MRDFASKVRAQDDSYDLRAADAERAREVMEGATHIRVEQHEDLFKLFPLIDAAYTNFSSKVEEGREELGEEYASEAQYTVDEKLLDVIERWQEELPLILQVWQDQAFDDWAQAQVAFSDPEKQKQLKELFNEHNILGTSPSSIFREGSLNGLIADTHAMEDFINDASAALQADLEAEQ